MRTTIITTALCLFSLFSLAQNVGIGITSPIARLHIADSNVVFTGPATLNLNTPYNPPISGAGGRTMWYPAKGAFRTGVVTGPNWDKDSIGFASFASGYDSKALGNSSIAMGEFATASKLFAIAIGRYATATSFSAVSIGEKNVASGAFSVAMGIVTKAAGESSVSMGNNTVTKARGGFTTGLYNDTLDFPDNNVSDVNDRIFQIGNGMDGARSNAITILRNANTGIGTLIPSARLHVADSNVVFTGPATVPLFTTYDPPIQGAGTRMMWYPQKGAFRVGYVGALQWDKNNIGVGSIAMGGNTTASGSLSTSMGYSTIASGENSTAMGVNTNASGLNSTAMGEITVAYGHVSTAMGSNTYANGDFSTAMGNVTSATGQVSTTMGGYTTAIGDFSTAMGVATTAKSYAETAIGSYNTNYIPSSSTNWNATDRLFVIGNGTVTASDAMVVLKNGNTGIGTSTPTEKLEVAGKIKTTNLQMTTGAANGNILTSDANGNASWATPVIPSNYWTASGGNIYNNNAGNVGIGTSTPHAQLQLATSLANRKIVLYEVADNDNQFQGFGMNFGVLRYQVNQTGDAHVFYAGTSATTSNELMRINGNGNVGIGNPSPTSKLQVDGAVRIQGNQTTHAQGVSLEWNNNPGSGATYLLNNKGLGGGGFILGEVDNANNITHRLDIDPNGNVGIGNAAPASKLEVNGALATKATYYGSGSGNVTLDNSATVWIFAVNGYSVSLPDPAVSANRRYMIVNKTNAAMVCSSFYNMANVLTTNIPANSSIEVIASNNTNRWEQIK